jgi:hypothetical protein
LNFVPDARDRAGPLKLLELYAMNGHDGMLRRALAVTKYCKAAQSPPYKLKLGMCFRGLSESLIDRIEQVLNI